MAFVSKPFPSFCSAEARASLEKGVKVNTGEPWSSITFQPFEYLIGVASIDIALFRNGEGYRIRLL